jgi:hypothetical protein
MAFKLTLEQELLSNFLCENVKLMRTEQELKEIVIDEYDFDQIDEDDIIKKPSRVFLERHKTFTSPKSKSKPIISFCEKDELQINNFEEIPPKTKKVTKSKSYEHPHIILQDSAIKHTKKKEQTKSHILRENVHILTNTINPPQSIQGLTSKKSRKKGIKRDRDDKCFLATR